MSTSETITTHKANAHTIGVNRDGKAIGTVSKITKTQWSARPYMHEAPFECYAGTFGSEAEAVAMVAAMGATPKD